MVCLVSNWASAVSGSFLNCFFLNHVSAGRSFDAFRADEQVSLLWSFAIVSVQSNVLCSSRCLKAGLVGRAGRAATPPSLYGTRKLLSLGGQNFQWQWLGR